MGKAAKDGGGAPRGPDSGVCGGRGVRGAGRRLDVEGRAGPGLNGRVHPGPGRAEGGYLAVASLELSDSGKPFKPSGPVSCSLKRRPAQNRPRRGPGWW